MPAPTPPSADDPDAEPGPPPPTSSRHGRSLAIGSLALAVVLGVAFGQVTGSLSDAATVPTGEGARAGLDGGRPSGPPGSVPVPAGLADGTRETATGSGSPSSSVPVTSTTGPSPLAMVLARPPDDGPPAAVSEEPSADSVRSEVPAGSTLVVGDRSRRVRALQERLHELGYWPGEPDGTYGEPTRQAVVAFQKAEGLDDVDGEADAEVVEHLAAASFGWGRSRAGEVIEIDRERQLLLVVEDGAVLWTLNTATDAGPDSGPRRGLSSAVPRGRYRVERQIDADYDAPTGTIHRPKYFDGTVAIHGTGEVPDPPPQGCACLTDAAMDMLWSIGAADVGTPVLVY